MNRHFLCTVLIWWYTSNIWFKYASDFVIRDTNKRCKLFFHYKSAFVFSLLSIVSLWTSQFFERLNQTNQFLLINVTKGSRLKEKELTLNFPSQLRIFVTGDFVPSLVWCFATDPKEMETTTTTTTTTANDNPERKVKDQTSLSTKHEIKF